MNQLISVRVLARTPLAEGIVSLELTPGVGNHLPAFTAGAHIDVHLPSGLIRQYSLCNSPDERHRYRIAILLERQSRGGSRYLHDEVNVGDILTISKPKNLFGLDSGQRSARLIAGGIGITPILAMAHSLYASGVGFELHYTARTRSRMAFLDELATAGFAGQVRTYSGDELRLDLSRALSEPFGREHLYICGPQGFIDAALEQAINLGWPASNVHKEHFKNSIGVPTGGERAFKVQIAATGHVYDVPPDRSVLEVLRAAGLRLDSSCEVGTCGTCVLPVRKGHIDHRDVYLSATERAAGDCFTPCCSRSFSDTLVIDL